MEQPLEKFIVDKELLKYVRMSSHLYREEIAKQKEARDKEEMCTKNNKLMAAQIKDLEEKKKNFLECARKETAKVEEEILKLQKILDHYSYLTLYIYINITFIYLSVLSLYLYISVIM